MKKYTVLLIFIAIFALLCACNSTTADDVTPTPTVVATPAQTITPTATPLPTLTSMPSLTHTPTPTSTPIPFHQTFESLVFDGEYTHEKLIELVTDFAIASDNEIFTLRQEYFPDSNNLDVKNFGWHYFTENNLFKLFIYRQGRLYSENARGQFIIPAKDVIDFLVERHFSHPVKINDKETKGTNKYLVGASKEPWNGRYVFYPSRVTIAEYDNDRDVFILDDIPSISVFPFNYNVTLHNDTKKHVGNLIISGTYIDNNNQEQSFSFGITTEDAFNKENRSEIIRTVFVSYCWRSEGRD